MLSLKDQRCPVDAPTADFFVSSLGELERHGRFLRECGSINLRELAERRGFDWLVVRTYRKPDECEEARRWFAVVEMEWRQVYAATLSLKEHAFLDRVLAFQRVVRDNGRFRVYGEIRKGRPRISVVTEFINDTENEKYWEALVAVAKSLKARVWIMHESRNTSESWREVDGQLIDHKYGPNYGKIERQVELSWRIERLSIPGFRHFLAKIRNGTRRLWKEGGVCVI